MKSLILFLALGLCTSAFAKDLETKSALDLKAHFQWSVSCDDKVMESVCEKIAGFVFEAFREDPRIVERFKSASYRADHLVLVKAEQDYRTDAYLESAGLRPNRSFGSMDFAINPYQTKYTKEQVASTLRRLVGIF